MNDDPDAADVRAVLGGDVEAFAGIVRRWQRPLYQLARRHTETREEAEDLTQETLLRAFRSLARWRGRSRFSTWLFAIALNVCRSNGRARPQRASTIESEPADPASGRSEPVAESVALRALAALPARYREALEAFYVRSLDVRSASRSLGLAEGTLKARLHRGRKLLAALLSTSHDSPDSPPSKERQP